MRRSTIQKLSSINNLIPKTLLGIFILIWLGINIPLCFLVLQYSRSRVMNEALFRQSEQERILLNVFEQGARFGDIINARNNVEAFGKPFGLKKINICKDGKDVIGDLQTGLCLGNKFKTLEILSEKLDVSFNWDTRNADLFNPLLGKAILGTLTLSLITFFLFGFLIYRVLRNQILKLSVDIGIREKLSADAYQIPELRPIISAVNDFREKLDAQNDALARLKTSEALGKLSKQVAHDIRSPLSALKVGLAKLNSNGDEIQLINSATSKIEQIAHDLLNFERAKVNSMTMGREFFADLIKLKESEIPDAIFSLNYALDSAMKVPIDQTDLFRSISNLINNSSEARVQGQPLKISIRVSAASSNVQVTVEDNGMGIPPEILRDLKQGQVSIGKSSDKAGFGLGLSFARALVVQASGVFTITSVVGNGTTVEFMLPAIPT